MNNISGRTKIEKANKLNATCKKILYFIQLIKNYIR